jgi:hypothetical protein
MKYCYYCGHVTAGEPLFCKLCGRSYDLKLCPRLHKNHRIAEVCSRCGSRVLSTPQPRMSVWWKVLSFILQAAFGGCLTFLSITAAVVLILNPHARNPLTVFAVFIGVLWWMWTEIPQWLKEIARRRMKAKQSNGD